MGKCFITRLPSSLKSNPNLRTFNSIRIIEVSPLAQGVNPTYVDSAVADFTNVLKFKSYDKDGNLVYENKSIGNGIQPDNVKYIELLDKDKTHGPSYLGTRFQYEDSLSTLCKLKNIRSIVGVSDKGVDCSLSEVAALTNLTNIELGDTKITGDISSLSALTNLTHIYLNTTKVTGDISSLSALTNLTEINLSNNGKVTGDISSLLALTNLTKLVLWSTGVTGDISSLSTLTNLESLSVSNTKVTGDISELIDKLTKLKKLEIPPTVTITDAQKKTLTDRGCSVYIGNY